MDLILDAVRKGLGYEDPIAWHPVEVTVVAAARDGQISLYLDAECTVPAAVPVDDALACFAKVADVQRWFALSTGWPVGDLELSWFPDAKWPAYVAPEGPRYIAGRRLWRLSEAIATIAALPGLGVTAQSLMKRATKAAASQELRLRDVEDGSPKWGDNLSGFLREWLFAEDLNAWLQAAGFPEPYRLRDDMASDPAEPVPVAAVAVAMLAEKSTPRAWTPERLEELRAYRVKHGTKKAAEWAGVSTSRVRKLLPTNKPQPKGYSAFNSRMK